MAFNIDDIRKIVIAFFLPWSLSGQEFGTDLYREMVVSHYGKQLNSGIDVYGNERTSFWLSSLSTYTGGPLEDRTRPDHIPQRAYLDRYVDAPDGSTFYWDQPSLVAAYNISLIEGNKRFKSLAGNYVKDFLTRCKADNGIFLWGNHYYYDILLDTVVKFGAKPEPVNFDKEKGDYHELRPFAPAWGILWDIDSLAVEIEIRESAINHISNANTGEFNRHADGEKGHAFIESGGILVYNLTWLYTKTKDESLLKLADRIADFSFDSRNSVTGLMVNDPTSSRWDSYTSTTEVGHWAKSILEAAKIVNVIRYKEKWQEMAAEVILSWLDYGYDDSQKMFYGMLNYKTGEPILRKEGDDYPYKPGNYSDIWNPLFPTHNYPITFAESCLRLYEIYGTKEFKKSCDLWVDIIENSLPARNGMGAYAEHYGRVIFYLMGCDERFTDSRYKELALRVAKEGTDVLFAYDMFRTHPGEYRYDSVDGVGILSLALLWIANDQKPDLYGLVF